MKIQKIIFRQLGFLQALIFLSSFAFSSNAQDVIGTNDSRFSATLTETKDGVIVQAIAVGPMIADVIEFSFFLNPDELVWSDKNFTGKLPYDDPSSIAFPAKIFNDNVELAKDIAKGGGKLEFEIAPVSRYREAGVFGPPELTHWSGIPGWDALIISIFDPKTRLNLPASEIEKIFTCYFKKVHQNRLLQTGDIGFATNTNTSGGKFCPKWTFGGNAVSYEDAGLPGMIWPQVFSYRTPSSVFDADVEVDEIAKTSVLLSSSFERGAMEPSNELFDGKSPGSAKLRSNGRLNWDKVTRSGFIYTKDPDVTTLFVEEYSDVLLIKGAPHTFPSLAGLVSGEFSEFTVGDYTFYIVMKDNSLEDISVDYSIPLTDLTLGANYLFWPCIGYKYDTSREYFKLGMPASYATGPECVEPPKPVVTASQSFCDDSKVSDLEVITAYPAGTVLGWYDNVSASGTPLTSDTKLKSGVYYARAWVTGTTTSCYSDSVPVTVTINIVEPPTATPQQEFCGGLVSDLQANGNLVEWYSVPTGGTPLEETQSLSTGIYYASQSDDNGCKSTVRSLVNVEVNLIIPDAPSITALQILCGDFKLSDIMATGTSTLKWYTSDGKVLDPSTKLTNETTYHAAQIVGGCESVKRTAVTVYINPTVEITGEPVSQYLCPGESEQVQFNVGAKTTAGSLSYQWYRNGQLLTGSTSSTLSLSLQNAKNNIYSVTVSNECNSKSSVDVSAYESFNIIDQKRNHTLLVNNNPSLNGGHTFEYYKWYKNGHVIQDRKAGGASKGGYYYAGIGEELDMGAIYYAEVWDKSGKMYRTCEFTPERKYYGTVSVYPNPLMLTQPVYVEADLDTSELANATIELYSSNGSYIGQFSAERLTPVTLPEEKGVYILKFKTEEREENFKIIVK